MKKYIICVLSLMISNACFADTPQGKSPEKIKTPEQKIFQINKTDTILSEVLSEIQTKYHINYLCDLCLFDKYKRVNIQIVGKDQDDFILKIAKLFGRIVIKRQNIYILRSVAWTEFEESDKQIEKEVKTIKYTEKPVFNVEFLNKKSLIDELKMDLIDPTTEIALVKMNINTAESSIQPLLNDINKRTQWSISVKPEWSQRHVSVSLQNCQLSDFISSVSLLLNGRQRTIIDQTDEQKQREEKENPNKLDVEKISDKLRQKLVDKLSSEDKKKYENGDTNIYLNVGNLPADLKQGIGVLIQAKLDLLANSVGGGSLPEIDMSRINEFTIQVAQPPWALYMVGRDAQGNLVGF
jgi:hypothetical protein